MPVPAMIATSRDYHAYRSASHLPGDLIPIAKANHFTIVDELRRISKRIGRSLDVRYYSKSGHGDLRAKVRLTQRPTLRVARIPDLCASEISVKLAAYFWIGRVTRYFHLRAAQIGIARLSAEHCDRGVPRNQSTQHIGVGA
jgi:hypothetical protein